MVYAHIFQRYKQTVKNRNPLDPLNVMPHGASLKELTQL